MNCMRFRWKKTITKYLLLELISPFFLGLLIFTFVLLMERVLDLIELIINKGVSVTVVLKMILYIMPSFLVLTIPMAVLVATLTAFGRLSTDSEVTALKASGVSLYALFAPVLIFALMANALTFFLYAKALPWGNLNFRIALYELARTKAAIGMKKHVFDTTFPSLVIYVDDIDAENVFHGVMISDSRDARSQQTIFAKTGRLISDERTLRVILRLEHGASHPKSINVSSPFKYQVYEFPVLDILLSFQGSDNNMQMDIPRTDRDMTISLLGEEYSRRRLMELSPNAPPSPIRPESLGERLRALGVLLAQVARDSVIPTGSQDSSPYLVELHKRFSIPFACVVFGLIGTPLGIQSRRSGKSGGFAISVVLLLIYYIFISAGESLGDNGRIPVLFAVWTPNLLLGVTGIILLVRAARR